MTNNNLTNNITYTQDDFLTLNACLKTKMNYCNIPTNL